jgi:ubiquinone/menaquinone biosynthesis C-methylase UbiE
MARYDDELWEQVPEDPGPPAAHLSEFIGALAPAERTLDVGIGDGRLAREIETRRLTGVDVSQVALDRARTRLPDAELVLVQPDEELPFADNVFDLVTCIETIEHVRDVQLLLSEIRRVLVPGGALALTTPATAPLARPEHPFSPHLHRFTSRSLRRALEELGFEVESLRRRRGTLLALARR